MGAALVALLILVPSALAAADLSAATLDVVGDAQLRSDLQAFFTVLGSDPLSWEGEAAGLRIERTWQDWYQLPGAIQLAQPGPGWQTETVTMEDARLVSSASREGGAFLARGSGDVLATTPAGLAIAHAVDPSLDQGPPPDVEAGEGDRMTIHEVLSGEFIVVRVEDGLVELRGELTLELRDVDYEATDASGARSFRTGTYATQDLAAAQTLRKEYQTLTLTDAVLRVTVAQPADLYAHQADLSLAGQLVADGAAVPGLIETGRTTLGVAPAGGLIQATRTDLGAASAQAPAAFSASLALPLAASLALALALALVVARRRRGDDVEAALLAMSERRWADALPRLRRALRRSPDDATLLLDHALCLEMTGRLPGAARGYEAALRRAPKSAEAHYFLARTLAKLQQAEPGTVHLQTALELDPRLADMARAEQAFRALGVSR